MRPIHVQHDVESRKEKLIMLESVLASSSLAISMKQNFRAVEKEASFINAFTEPAVLMDRSGRIIDANSVLAESLGRTVEEMRGACLWDMLSPEAAAQRRPYIEEALRTGKPARFVDKRGNRWIDNSVRPFLGRDGKVDKLAVFGVDITERKEAGEELMAYRETLEEMVEERTEDLRKLNRILRTVSDCNEILVRASDEKELLTKICRTIVDIQIPRVAWVSYVDGDRVQTLRPVAQAATEADAGSDRIAHSEALDCRGPTAMAVREGQPCILDDLRSGPDSAAWAREAVKRGYLSSVSIPLFSGETVLGALSICAKEPEAFGPEEVRLLTELAGDLAFGIMALRMRAERKEAEEALKESEQRFRTLFENVPVGVYNTAPDGRIMAANPTLVKMLGYSSFEELAKRDLDKAGFEPHHPRADFKRLMERDGSVNGLEGRWLRKDGSVIVIRENATTVRGKNGRVLFYEGTIEDITESKHAEEALKASEEKLRSILVSSPDAITVTDLNGTVVECNQETLAIHGYSSKDDVIGKNAFSMIAEKDRKTASENMKKVLEQGSVKNIGYALVTRDGREFPGELSASVIKDSSGKLVGFVAVTRDITKRKQAEERMMAALREKEVLLKEIHHRVKNNLQVIISLLSLQSRQVRDKTLLNAFRDSQSRIQSIALIHEKLYKSKDVARVDFAGYIQNLVPDLLRTYGLEPGMISLDMNVEDIRLGIDTAVPCGLIINELVTNCLKHAFPGGRKGKIAIVFRSAGNGRTMLSVGDNGLGFPPDIDIRNAETMGLKMVGNLTEQLDGTLELERNGGTTFKVTFNAEPGGR
jgi:PAS domain S-box-containing protein